MKPKTIKMLLLSFLVSGIALLFAFPFIWMVFASFKSNQEIYRSFPILPESYSFVYYEQLMNGEYIPFWTQFFNSFLISTLQTLGMLMLTVSAAYVFARYAFRGKHILFMVALLTIVVPKQSMLIPMFEWMIQLKLTDTLTGMILPGMVSGLALLYFTQVFKKIPSDLIESARIEGAGEIRIFWMMLPLVKPSLLTYAFLHFILSWNEHLFPMIFTQSEDKMTLTVALSMLMSKSMRFETAILMAGSVFLILPAFIMFILLYKHFKSALADLMHS